MSPSSYYLGFVGLMQCLGRGHVQHWDDPKSYGKVSRGGSLVVESHSPAAYLLGCHGEISDCLPINLAYFWT